MIVLGAFSFPCFQLKTLPISKCIHSQGESQLYLGKWHKDTEEERNGRERKAIRANNSESQIIDTLKSIGRVNSTYFGTIPVLLTSADTQ